MQILSQKYKLRQLLQINFHQNNYVRQNAHWDTIPKIRNEYYQKRNCTSPVPISTPMCLRAIYILPRSVCLFCFKKYVDRSWEYINRSQAHECENWAEAAQFIFWEYIFGIFVAVLPPWHCALRLLCTVCPCIIETLKNYLLRPRYK
jgi:hypothetical protein